MPCDPTYLDLALNAMLTVMAWEGTRMIVGAIMRVVRMRTN